MDTFDTPTHFSGPLDLAHAHTRLNIVAADAAFTRDGPRADVEYRDLGLAAATGGRIGAKHIRAIGPFEQETGWHWHDMTGHFVFVLKGWITFRFAGVRRRRHGAGRRLPVAAGRRRAQRGRPLRRPRADRDQPAGRVRHHGSRRREGRAAAVTRPCSAHPAPDAAQPCGARSRAAAPTAPRASAWLRRARRAAARVRRAVRCCGNTRSSSSASRSTCCRRPRRSGPSSSSAPTSCWRGAWVTTQEIIGGYLLAVVVSIPLALAVALFALRRERGLSGRRVPADHPEDRDRAAVHHLVRLRLHAEAADRLPALLLPDRRREHRRLQVGRSRDHGFRAHHRRRAAGRCSSRSACRRRCRTSSPA